MRSSWQLDVQQVVSKPVPFETILWVQLRQRLARCKRVFQNGPMKIGYARVSSDTQNLDLQRDALTACGCTSLYEDDGVTGDVARRPGLDQALAALAPGDVLVTWRLDRLGRSLPHLIHLVETLQARGCEFVSLTEAIDTTSAGGRLVFHIMGALAEFERALIIERTKAGIAAARRRDQHLGRPRALSPAQVAHARAQIEAGAQTTASMARLMDVSKATLWRALRKA